jgi:hypothetical protein
MLQHIEARNMRRVSDALTDLSRRVGFRVIPGLGERVTLVPASAPSSGSCKAAIISRSSCRAATWPRPIAPVVLRNRLQHIEARNMRRVSDALTDLSRRVGFRVGSCKAAIISRSSCRAATWPRPIAPNSLASIMVRPLGNISR